MAAGTNIALQVSGTALDGAVLAGSHAVQMVLLCGLSGLQAIPVMVTGSGELITKTI